MYFLNAFINLHIFNVILFIIFITITHTLKCYLAHQRAKGKYCLCLPKRRKIRFISNYLIQKKVF